MAVIGALFLWLTAASSQQLYVGPGLSWTPSADRPWGLLVEGWYAVGSPGQGTFGTELGPMAQLRFPGFREVRGTLGVTGGVMWGKFADQGHLGYTQIDLEAGAAFGGGLGLHLGLSGSKALDPWLAGPRCIPLDGPGCRYSNWPLSFLQLHPRAYAVLDRHGWGAGGDLSLRMGVLPLAYLL